MKSPRLSTRISRAAVLFTSVLAGIFLQLPGTATAQTTADLAISIYNTPLDVYVNDYMPYTMFVTNLGPGTVSSVVVTNILPSGFSLIDASPTYTLSGNTLSFNLGSLTNLAVRKLIVRAKPASAGNYTFSTSISAASNTDPNNANNSASFTVGVGNFLSGNLTPNLIGSQVYDSQDGLVEQKVQLSNNGTSPVASARIIVSGLTSQQLWNAAGTNNGNPFLIYGAPINPGQSGTFMLQFAALNYFAFSNSQMQPYATPLANLDPPANLIAPFTPYSMVRLTNTSTIIFGSTLIWFSSSLNTNVSYSVVYSDDPSFSHPLITFPMTIAGGSTAREFIDYGPPATISLPTNSTPRYYRIYLNP